MQINEPTHIEAFEGWGSAILITAPDRDYLQRISIEFCAEFAVPFGKTEAGIAGSYIQGPDHQIGLVCTIWINGTDPLKLEKIRKELGNRIKSILLQKLGIRIFNWTPTADAWFQSDEYFSEFSGGYGKKEKKWDRDMYNIPRMGGNLAIETRIGFQRAILGVNFWIYWKNIKEAILLESQIREICQKSPNVALISGLIGSGSHPQSSKSLPLDNSKKYQIQAITNLSFCPELRDQLGENSAVPDEISCITEIILNGFSLNTILDVSRKLGEFLKKQSAVLKISTGNYYGKMGTILIPLLDILK
jgi:formylmethanofuran--tetrahydromethanopterin N-formyltransferase